VLVKGGARINEHRFVTVLFSDLSRYTRLSSLLDPEELKGLMENIFMESVRVISSYDGVVEKFLGDAVVAIFGIHRIHEDDIIRAIRSAKAIHEFVEGLGHKTADDAHGVLSMHTGIHTGTVLVDEVTRVPLYQSIIGMPIIIAQRLSGLAGPGEVLIGGSSRYEAERFFVLEPLGKKELKGVTDPVPVYRVGSQRSEPLGIRRPGSAGAPMVDREEPLSALSRAFEELAGGKAAAVLITGEAGVGKSRLVYEFGRNLPSDAVLVTAQCLDHMRETPYYPVISLVRQMLEMLREGDRGEAPDLEGRLLNPRHAFHIRSLLGYKHDGEDLMPDVWKTEICESVSGLLRACAGSCNLVVCIEDFHWADATTRDLVSYLLQEDDQLGCLFIVTSREMVTLHASQSVLHLQEISREHARTLILKLLGMREIPEDAVDALYQTTGGNPLYLEEYVSYLREEGISPLQTADPQRKGGIPETIQGLLSARMENLGKERKRLLQEASILGMVFPRDLLEAVASVGGDIGVILADLEGAGFVAHAGEGEYRFRHALTREVAAMTLLRRHRQQLHKKVGTHLERVSKSRAEHCGMIAYHFYHAREYARAVPYFILAARTYQAEGAWMEAAAQYKRAEDCLLSDKGYPGREDTLILMREGVWSCSRIFDPDQAIHALEELVRHYAHNGPKSQEVFSKIRLINLYSQKARFHEALALFDQVRLEEGLNDLLTAAAKTAVAYTYTFLGKPVTALDYLEEARATLDAADRFLSAVNSLTTLAAWVWRGNTREALAWYARTKRQSAPYMDLDLMTDVWHGYILFLKGEVLPGQGLFESIRSKEKKLGSLAGGISYLRTQSMIYLYSRFTGWTDMAARELEMLESMGNDHARFPGLMDLYRSWIALGRGDYQEAVNLAGQCLPLLEAGIANRAPYALNTLAEALLRIGDTAGAGEIASRSVDWNEQNGNAEQLIWAWRIMAGVCMKAGDHEAARDLLKNASVLSYDRDMKPHIAWTTESWGDLHAALGMEKKAAACYRRSISLWNEMGLPHQARQAGNALVLCSPPG
jgi:class 3 adenylate cyclase/tetratricopeptide (TPR) repeat protein